MTFFEPLLLLSSVYVWCHVIMCVNVGSRLVFRIAAHDKTWLMVSRKWKSSILCETIGSVKEVYDERWNGMKEKEKQKFLNLSEQQCNIW